MHFFAPTAVAMVRADLPSRQSCIFTDCFRKFSLRLSLPESFASRPGCSSGRTEQDRALLEGTQTDRSRRTIALLGRLVQELRRHRKEQAELRLKLGLGKDGRDLAFSTWDGNMQSSRPFSKEFAREAAAAGVPHVTFHGLRHPISRICCAAEFRSMSYPFGLVTRIPPSH